MTDTNGIDKKLKTAVAISIAFHVVLLSLAIVAAPRHTSGPITIELITAGLTGKAGLSGKKHAPIQKASHAAHASSVRLRRSGGHPAHEFPPPSPDAVIPPLPVAMIHGNEIPAPLEKGETVEEHPMAGEEKQESNTFEAASMPFAEDNGNSEDNGGEEGSGGSEDYYGGSEGNGGSEDYGGSGAKSIASGNRHAAQFLSLVREKIEKAKFYPPLARKKGYEGVVRVGFTIKKNGKLEDLHVLRPCHCEALDSAATEAIKKASPFGPVPETFPDEGIRLEIDVAYRLTD